MAYDSSVCLSKRATVTKGAGLTDRSVCLSEGVKVTKGAGLTDRSIVLPKMRSLFTLFSCLKLMTFSFSPKPQIVS